MTSSSSASSTSGSESSTDDDDDDDDDEEEDDVPLSSFINQTGIDSCESVDHCFVTAQST